MSESFFDDIDSTVDAKAKADAEARDSDKFDPSPGDMLRGVLLKAERPTTQFGKGLVVTFRNVGEEAVGGIEPGNSGYMFASTVLERMLQEQAPRIGSGIAIRYEGKVTPDSGGNPYKDWTVVSETSDRGLWVGLYAGADEDKSSSKGEGNKEWSF